MRTRVLVTGATGFVGGHCVADLLRHGYDVRATVRDLQRVGSGATTPLTRLARLNQGQLEFVKANLDSGDGWAAAVDGCTYVLHIASPFPATAPADESGLIRPAVAGTLRVLRACAESPATQRVVLTSSTAAVTYGHQHETVYTEQDWTVVARSPAYPKSKTLAERAAWDFVAGLPDRRGLELAVLNPGMILGPIQHPATSTSHEPVRRLLAGALPGNIRVGWSIVDVRDLATAHRLAMESPVAAGNRFICAGEFLWMREIAQLLAGEFGPGGFKVPVRELPDWLIRMLARVDSGMQLALPNLGQLKLVSAERARRELGWSMRPVRQTLVDTANSLIRHGIVNRPRSAPDWQHPCETSSTAVTLAD